MMALLLFWKQHQRKLIICFAKYGGGQHYLKDVEESTCR
jgi:hypothetical protein